MNRRKLPLTGLIRESGFTVGAISVIVTIAFTMLILSPTAFAVRQEWEQPQGYVPETAEARFTQTMVELTDRLKHWREALRPDGYAPPRDAVRGRDSLRDFRRELSDLDPQVRTGFDELRRHLESRDAAPVMLERQQTMQRKYDDRYAQFQRLMDRLQAAVGNRSDEIQALEDAIEFLDKYPSGRPQRPFDPENLPFLNLQPLPDNTPMMSREAYQKAGLVPAEPVEKQSVGTHAAAAPAAMGRGVGGDPDDFDKPEYLAETDEIVITDFIEAKAAELEHDPVQIFHWVRNNVGWLPTWGAQQDSDITLGSERGNAFDIASLLIALLRASDIPARYAHGTIEVDADTFRNWSSGFDDIDSAIALASSGGIPIVGINQGGQIRKVQMEHVWVEVALDYEPSRGANHIEPDNWVPMDPSFKQYEYLEGLDPLEISDVDPDQLAQDFIGSGTVNEEESWVSGFDPQILADAQEQVQTDLEAYIEDNINDPTVGDVIGGRKVIVKEYPTVPSALPYRMLVDEARYAAVPEALQQAITLAFGISHSGFPVDPISIPWAKVNNHKLTISFSPATQADEHALLDLIPEDAEDSEDLPTSIPSTIEVTSELKLNDELIHSGTSMALGEELTLFNQVFFPGRGSVTRPLSVIVGSYMAVGSESGSVSIKSLERLQNKLDETKSAIESADPAQIAILKRESLLGDVFYSGMLNYYGQYGSMGELMGKRQEGLSILTAGMGVFGYEPRVNTLFGFPRGISPGGVALDIPIAGAKVVDGLRYGDLNRFNQQVGILSSALEHSIPERIFSSEEQQANAVSAVKALSIASAEGQKIFELTHENVGQTLPQLNLLQETEREIERAVNAGLTVIAHADPVSVPGWQGAGYIILDENSGSGAYKISGGANGGFLKTLGLILFFILAAAFLVALVSAAIAGGLILLAAFPLHVLSGSLIVATIVLAISDINSLFENCSDAFLALMLSIMVVSIAVLNLALGLVESVISFIVGMGVSIAAPEPEYNC